MSEKAFGTNTPNPTLRSKAPATAIKLAKNLNELVNELNDEMLRQGIWSNRGEGVVR